MPLRLQQRSPLLQPPPRNKTVQKNGTKAFAPFFIIWYVRMMEYPLALLAKIGYNKSYSQTEWEEPAAVSVMSRTKAREIALHLIFEMGFRQFEEESLDERLDEEIMASISGDIALYAGKLSAEQTQYIRSVVRGVAAHIGELDQTIEANAKGWKLSRLSRMTTAVLRLAIYEMRYVDDVPAGVAINEAVELAKVYDTEEAASFINGVLGAVARAEFPQDASAAKADKPVEKTDA